MFGPRKFVAAVVVVVEDCEARLAYVEYGK